MSTPQDDVKKRFLRNVEGHEMTVLHDDGLYRSVRFRNPERWQHHFTLVTSPGILLIHGDMHAFVLSREPDMFAWVGSSGRANPGYWGQKEITRAPTREYDERYAQRVMLDHVSDEALDDLDPEDREEVQARAREIVTVGDWSSSDTAHTTVGEFIVPLKGSSGFYEFTDTWEWDFTTDSYHWLWCCEAIAWGVAWYLTRETPEEKP